MTTPSVAVPEVVHTPAEPRPASFLTRVVRRFAYPAQAPFLSLTVYYALLLAFATVLVTLVPELRQAFSGERLTQLSGQDFTAAFGGNAAAGGLGGMWLSWSFAAMLGVSMVGAFLLMVPASWVYMATRRRKGFDQSVVQTMVVLALAVAGVVVIVRNSLALAFSLAGIVGAVRFRNSLPDTRDTLYIFLSIGIGLAAGVEALAAAFVLSAVFNYVSLFMWRTDYGMCELGHSSAHLLHADCSAGRIKLNPNTEERAIAPPIEQGDAGRGAGNGHGKKPYNAVLVVRARGTESDPARNLVETFLREETKRWELAEVENNVASAESVLRYRVRLGKKVDPEGWEEALLQTGAPVLIGARVH